MPTYICTQCRYAETPRTRKRGSKGMETVAWMLFPFGLPYTLWRMLSKTRECRHCACTAVVKLKSPMGKRLLALEARELGEMPIVPQTAIKSAAPPEPAPPSFQPRAVPVDQW
jgi:hypothetical protein